MKTRALARNLSALSKALRSLPDMELEELANLTRKEKPNIALGLSTLTALSSIDKGQWIEFISDNNLPIETRPRDASRDILGKIMTYLQDNSEARARIAKAAADPKNTVSPELQRAFSVLLRP